jgi:hypothetical protein
VRSVQQKKEIYIVRWKKEKKKTMEERATNNAA